MLMQFKGSTFDTLEVKAEYCTCLKRLSSLISSGRTSKQTGRVSLEDLKDEISRLESSNMEKFLY
ncbi:kinesin light chain 3 [Cucumis melo var. makuwa]|uniref:Kinesin light chain 3 n=1 Tax=Cucumis melo var. makuwa TaxID=1194695 RepID=A0A5D3CSN7_CUCMM|nr:kinesin light chain 3 [Cucumis melo var. makuwa]